VVGCGNGKRFSIGRRNFPMTRGQKVVAYGYGGLTGFSALVFIALFIVIAFGSTGCDTNKSSLVGPTREQVTVTPAGAYVEIEGKMQKALVENDPAGRWAINGVSVKVIMVLDYPCGFIGPLPEGHGRDCTDDPNGTPSDEPPTARYIGDPTTDE
jgi:hypothetical protein